AGVETVLPHGGYILVVSAEHTAVRGDQQPRVAVVAVRVAADEGPGGDRTVPDGEIPQQLGARTVDRQCGVGHQVTEPHTGGEELGEHDPLGARRTGSVAELAAPSYVLADVADPRFELCGRDAHVSSRCRFGRCRACGTADTAATTVGLPSSLVPMTSGIGVSLGVGTRVTLLLAGVIFLWALALGVWKYRQMATSE